jgi:hypothetical protein
MRPKTNMKENWARLTEPSGGQASPRRWRWQRARGKGDRECWVPLEGDPERHSLQRRTGAPPPITSHPRHPYNSVGSMGPARGAHAPCSEATPRDTQAASFPRATTAKPTTHPQTPLPRTSHPPAARVPRQSKGSTMHVQNCTATRPPQQRGRTTACSTPRGGGPTPGCSHHRANSPPGRRGPASFPPTCGAA